MQTRQYFGCVVRQRIDEQTVRMFAFYARAKDITQWVGIKRIEEIADGTQRLLRPSRKRAIISFLKASAINTIPNNILVAFEPEKAKITKIENAFNAELADIAFNGCKDQLEWGVLEFTLDSDSPEHDRVAYIVDGQHRLYGAADFLDEDLPLLVVGLVDASVLEQAFQFIVINSKAVKVAVGNAKSIIADAEEDTLQERLLSAGVKYGETSPLLREVDNLPTSPFNGLLDWPANRTGPKLVPLTAIEQAISYLRTVFEFLFEDDEDSLLELFLVVWQGVKLSYPTLWGRESDASGNKNKLMLKVSINALNEYITDRLKIAWEMGLIDLFDLDAVQRQVTSILSLLPSIFWEAEWAIRIQDNANVRDLIRSDMSALAENSKMRRLWSTNLKIVKPKTED